MQSRRRQEHPTIWRLPSLTFLLTGVLLAGCEGAPSTLAPAGPAAAEIAVLWWVLLALASVATVIVVVLLGIALVAHPKGPPDAVEAERRSNRLIVGGGIVLPALMIPAVLFMTYVSMAGFPTIGTDRNLTVRVVAHQFWWEVQYPELGVVTANEIHIPAGRPIRFEVTSEDVIHSFWVPQLHGKIDALPDRDNVIVLEASETGAFRGICAEFCGIQHAHMYFHVVASSEDEFDAWVEQQLEPAPGPVEPDAQRGRELFLTSACAGCHAIAGTVATATEAPDLTHLMSREWIASGMLPNTTENLRAFVDDPQRIKPGNLMPPAGMTPDDLDDLIAYLETLE